MINDLNKFNLKILKKSSKSNAFMNIAAKYRIFKLFIMVRDNSLDFENEIFWLQYNCER